MAEFLSVKSLAEQWGCSVNEIYEQAARREDPLPLRYLAGRSRSGFVPVWLLQDWVERNTVPYSMR